MTHNGRIRGAAVFLFLCLVAVLDAQPTPPVVPAAVTDGAPHDVSGRRTMVLDPREEAWLDGHSVLRVDGPRAFPPFQFLDPDGNEQGMAHDYLHFIMDQIGLKIEFQKDLP